MDCRRAVVWRIGMTTSDVIFIDLPSYAKQLCVRHESPRECVPDETGQAWWSPGLALGQHSVALAHEPGNKMVLMDLQGRLIWHGPGQWPERDPTGRFFAVSLVDGLQVLDGTTGSVLASYGRGLSSLRSEPCISELSDLDWWPSGLGLCCRVWIRVEEGTGLLVRFKLCKTFLALGFA